LKPEKEKQRLSAPNSDRVRGEKSHYERRAAVRKTYQRRLRKSRTFEVVGGRELAVRLPLPLVEVWEELQVRVEQLAGEAGLKILRALLEEEVTQKVGPPYRQARRRVEKVPKRTARLRRPPRNLFPAWTRPPAGASSLKGV